ncbi:MAG: efflux RND transporter permease subunit [Desulfomonilaceae bacterium]
MQTRGDRGNPSKIYWADVFVDYRRLLVWIVVVTSIVLACFVPGLETDTSLRSMLVTNVPAYLEYEKFTELFGNEEFIIIGIKNRLPASDQSILKSLESITNQLEKFDKVTEVISLTNLRFFQKRGEKFGTFPVIWTNDGRLALPGASDLAAMRKALPLMEFLISPNMQTVGLLVRADKRWKFDSDAIRQLLADITRVVDSNLVAGSDARIVGPAILRQAVAKYSFQTAYIFGILSSLICMAVTVYVFKSVRVTAVALGILGICVLWVLGLMSLIRMSINPITSMAFGLTLIPTLEIVIHIVTRYHQFYQWEKNKVAAVRQTVRFLARPLFISLATTAVGFGTCMVNSIPMVFQLGLIMPLAIMSSYCVAMILTPAFLLGTKSLDRYAFRATSRDLLSGALEHVRDSISKHHRLYTIAGFAITAIMFAGARLILTDPQIIRQLSPSSPEIQAIKFIDDNLMPVHSVELVLAAKDQAFKKPEIWKQVRELETRLRELPEVVSTESFLSVLEYVDNLVGGSARNKEDFLLNPAVLNELFAITSLSAEGKRLGQRYLDPAFDRLRITVRIKNSSSTPIVETLDQIAATADSVMQNVAQPTVTGELAVVSAESVDLIRSEIQSMILALVLITILMMIQMGTPSFGLISLIPNIPPLATVFGLMGWAGISLNGATIFATTVAIGLAVDNTIQYVAQLKREIKLDPGLGVEKCVFQAYNLASKPMASWSIVTALGFFALVATPFQAAVDFGILVSCAVLMGIFGDLVFMQSMILTFPWIRRLIMKIIEKEISTQKQ